MSRAWGVFRLSAGCSVCASPRRSYDMTERLYYSDSFLAEFDAAIVTVLEGSRPALILDRTAFYPTSGGQVSDTGRLHTGEKSLRIIEVAEDDQQQIVHYLEGDL